MADNYLITGYWGEPHVTVENDRGFNAAVFGTGKFVLPVGEMFRAEYIGNNTIRVYDGKLIDNGAVAGIPAGEYVEFTIPEAGQSMKRNDLIVFEYSRHESTLVESGVFKVLSGAETSETAVDPVLTENDLLSNIASFDQMALWRIPVSGASISAPEILYNTRFAGERIANVTSTDGKAYTANLPGIAKLYNGLEIIIIPDITSTTTLPSLNINGIGAVNIKRRITSNTRTTVQSEDDNFLYKDQPIRVIYNGSAWVADMARANVNDLYGTVPIEKGGTGADNAVEACENLGAISATQKGASYGVASLDSSGKVPSSQLPSMNYIPTSQKGAANGVAPLSSAKTVAVENGGTGSQSEVGACYNIKVFCLAGTHYGLSVSDWNDAIEPGYFSMQANLPNRPYTGSDVNTERLEVAYVGDGYRQTALITTSNGAYKEYKRYKRINGAWSVWKETLSL